MLSVLHKLKSPAGKDGAFGALAKVPS
jgi:hypothetical protein